MKKVIVSTTIANPTEAIRKFDNLNEWTLIVAGDLKTPKDFKLKNGIYISPKEQEKYNKELSDLVGWNTHARRNFGNLLAKDLNADIIAMVDDDNIPLNGWGDNLVLGNECGVNFYETKEYAFDPVGATNYPHLWHRGFPIQLLHKRDYSKVIKNKIRVDIQADFWNGDPDIDAICRVVYQPHCEFDESFFPLASNKPSPFNSQNIFLTEQVLQHYFFLPHISPFGRNGDIWISYHLQSLGFNVVYCKSSVYQKRNAHNVIVDMKDEIVGYQKNIRIVEAINKSIYKKELFWPERTCKAYEVYRSCFG